MVTLGERWVNGVQTHDKRHRQIVPLDGSGMPIVEVEMASKGASTSLDHWADIRQAAEDEANDECECQCGCGKPASRADGWYLANGAGPYRDECYERIVEPEEIDDDA